MPDPETGEKIAVSHMIPRSKQDLLRRHKALRRVAEFSVGLMGRTPDYMNVTYAGFAGRSDEWGANGNEEGAANLVAFQKELARNDLSLTHTLIHAMTDQVERTRAFRSRRNPVAHRRKNRARHPRPGRSGAGHAGAVFR